MDLLLLSVALLGNFSSPEQLYKSVAVSNVTLASAQVHKREKRSFWRRVTTQTWRADPELTTCMPQMQEEKGRWISGWSPWGSNDSKNKKSEEQPEQQISGLENRERQLPELIQQLFSKHLPSNSFSSKSDPAMNEREKYLSQREPIQRQHMDDQVAGQNEMFSKHQSSSKDQVSSDELREPLTIKKEHSEYGELFPNQIEKSSTLKEPVNVMIDYFPSHNECYGSKRMPLPNQRGTIMKDPYLHQRNRMFDQGELFSSLTEKVSKGRLSPEQEDLINLLSEQYPTQKDQSPHKSEELFSLIKEPSRSSASSARQHEPSYPLECQDQWELSTYKNKPLFSILRNSNSRQSDQYPNQRDEFSKQQEFNFYSSKGEASPNQRGKNIILQDSYEIPRDPFLRVSDQSTNKRGKSDQPSNEMTSYMHVDVQNQPPTYQHKSDSYPNKAATFICESNHPMGKENYMSKRLESYFEHGDRWFGLNNFEIKDSTDPPLKTVIQHNEGLSYPSQFNSLNSPIHRISNKAANNGGVSIEGSYPCQYLKKISQNFMKTKPMGEIQPNFNDREMEIVKLPVDWTSMDGRKIKVERIPMEELGGGTFTHVPNDRKDFQRLKTSQDVILGIGYPPPCSPVLPYVVENRLDNLPSWQDDGDIYLSDDLMEFTNEKAPYDDLTEECSGMELARPQYSTGVPFSKVEDCRSRKDGCPEAISHEAMNPAIDYRRPCIYMLVPSTKSHQLYPVAIASALRRLGHLLTSKDYSRRKPFSRSNLADYFSGLRYIQAAAMSQSI